MSTSLSGGRGAAGNKIPKGYAAGKLQQFTPEQMGLFQQLFSHVSPGSQLSQQAMGSQAGFEPQEQLAARDFQNFQGQNASRFSGMGMGARRGSGFNNSMTQGSQDFAMQLAGQRQQLQRQALQDLMGMSGMLLGQRPEEQFLIKKENRPSGFAKALGIGLPVAGAVAGGIFGGPAGAAMGGSLGGSLASGFTGQGGSQSQMNQQASWMPTQWG